MKRHITPVLPLLVGGLLTGAASAQAPQDSQGLKSLTQSADLVMHGVVESIEYALSQPSGPEQIRVPFTFVTYRVDHVLRGEDPGQTLTLRFIGGFNPESERIMAASNAPQFDVGDEDILFVKDNASSLVPLVDGFHGRLRIIDGQVYSEHGSALQLDEEGELIQGPRFLLEEVATTEIMGKVFARDLGPQAISGPSDAMLAGSLMAQVAELADDMPGLQIEVAQADASEPFAGPDMTAAAAPAIQAQDNGGESFEATVESLQEPLPVRPNRERK